MSLLELDNVSIFYGTVEAVHEVTISVEEGEVVTILGANGAGKSTTLNAISGLVRTRGGHIRFDGCDISNRSPELISRLGIAHVPEGRHIFPGLSVRDNILLGASSRGRLDKRELKTDISRVLEIFPALGDRLAALGWTLSGGQQQMLALARGLMAKPRLLILDEPSLGLAPRIAQQVLDTVSTVRESGATVLLVEQNAVLALARSDRGYVLENGAVTLVGAAAELASNPTVRRAYLGQEVSTVAQSQSAASVRKES